MQELDQRKDALIEKIKTLSKDKSSLILLVILLIATAIRWYFLDYTQPLWWDEADYLNVAKHFAFDLPDTAAPWRARAIPMIWSVFYMLGGGEAFIRILEIIMSVGGVFLTYKAGKMLYNKWVGLAAAAMLAVSFEYLFWTTRISMDVYALFLWALIAILFWQGYNGNKKPHLIGAGLLMGFGVYAYDSIGFMAVFFGVYLLLTERLQFLRQGKFWLVITMVLLGALPFALYNYVTFDDAWGESSNLLYKVYPRFGRFATADFATSEGATLDWQRPVGEIFVESFAYAYSLPYQLKWPFFLLLLIGLAMLWPLFLSIDLLVKGKAEIQQKKELYLFLWAIMMILCQGIVLSTTGFIFEPRYLFPSLPAIFIISGVGLYTVYNTVRTYHRHVAIALVVALLVYGSYLQVTFADDLIESKKSAYAFERPAGEWLKAHTDSEDIIFSCSQNVPLMSYSERLVISFGGNNTQTDQLLEEKTPKYAVADLYYPICNYQYLQDRPDVFVPVQAYFLDENGQQPVIVIYEVQYSEMTNSSL